MNGFKKVAGGSALVVLIPILFLAAAVGAFSSGGAAPVAGVTCGVGTSGPQPAVRIFRTALFEEFPDLRSLGICNVRPTRGPYADGETWSQHAYCNAEDYTRPGAPESLRPVVRWIEENSQRFDVNHLITYPEGSGFEHVIHVDFHPQRTGDPRGRTCQSGELAAMILTHPRISLRPEASEDVAADRVDSRVLQVLLYLAEEHRLGPVGPLITGHSYTVRGTNRPSNHAFGRAVDIAVIDGDSVSFFNPAARDVMEMVLQLPPPLLPDELGGPFSLQHPTVRMLTSDHDDHVHVGWDE
ncbi:MAG TPA: hypothetical protein VFH75_03400 [Actinomycetota bacterium]|nr:hypothetical protein [Actinomycetota bacterium]